MSRLFHTAPAACAIALVATGSASYAKPSLAPSVIAPQAAKTTIVITSKTHHIDVHEDDSVLFKVGTQEFAIRFDGNAVNYNLATLAPKGLIRRKIGVYVTPNPTLHQQGIP